MLTYLLVLAVVVVVLWTSFRALGGGAPVAAQDFRTSLARLRDFAGARARELDAALSSPPPATVGGGDRPRADPLVEAASAARKSLGGYHQQLARLESDAEGDEADGLEAARTLLVAAVEDLAWACRLAEAGTVRDNPGMAAAIEALREHGERCFEAAAPLLEGPPAAERS